MIHMPSTPFLDRGTAHEIVQYQRAGKACTKALQSLVMGQPTCGMLLETVARRRGTLWAGEGQPRLAPADVGLDCASGRPASNEYRPDPCLPVSLARLDPAWKEEGGSAGATWVLHSKGISKYYQSISNAH